MFVISTKLYFVEVGLMHQKLWIFKCTMLKTLNSDCHEWEDTLSQSQTDSRSGIRLDFKSLILLEVFPTLVSLAYIVTFAS